MRPKFVLGGLISEAWARSSTSYVRSMEYYNARVRNGIQPRTPFINLFDVQQQNTVLVVANLIYLLVTMGLFIYMKKRKTGLRLRWTLVIYDAINVIVAAYIAISTINYKLGHGGLLLCNPISNDPEGYRIANIFVLFYLQKYFEFIDTWFFVLRKSSRQVTFLHLFHHSSITIVVGTILPFDYNGDMYLPILLNSANHMLVYLHYLLASLGIQAWWAKYITSMQLGQFCLIFGQSLLSYRVGPTCGSPDFAKVLMTCYMGSLIALFGNFFLQKYIFRMPGSTVNMCGVIKQPATEVNLTSEHCGVIELNSDGVGIVYLNKTQHATFPDLTFLQKNTFSSISSTTSNNNLSHSQSPCVTPREAAAVVTDYYPSFQVVYHLTAIGSAMPNLHVKKEICRYTGSNNSNNGSSSSGNLSTISTANAVPINTKYVATISSTTGNNSNSNGSGNLIHSQSSNNIPFPPRDNNNNNNYYYYNNSTDIIRSSRYSTTSNSSNGNLRHSGLSSSGNGTAINHHQQPRSRSNSNAVVATVGVTANSNSNNNSGNNNGNSASNNGNGNGTTTSISRTSSTSSTNLPNLMNNIHSSSVTSTTTAAGDDEEIDITHSTNSKPSSSSSSTNNKKKKKNTSPGTSTNSLNNTNNSGNNSSNNSASTTPVANSSVSAALKPSPSGDEWWVSSSTLTEQFLAAASTTNTGTRNTFPSATTGNGVSSSIGNGLNMMPRSVSTGSLMPNSFNTITKSKSHDQLMYLQHNDRLIDGPLPLESLVETYRRQFSSTSSTTTATTAAIDSAASAAGNSNGNGNNGTNTLTNTGRSLDSISEHDLNNSSHSITASMSATDGINAHSTADNGNGNNAIATTYSATLASNTSRNSLSSSGSTSGNNLINIDSSSHSNLDYSINKNTTTTSAISSSQVYSAHTQQTQSHSLQQTLQQTQTPICFFTVAGGVAGGKVSWTVKTVPVSVKPANSSGSGGVTFLQGDWRSIT